MKIKHPNSGFALIITLMVSLVIAMMLGATLKLSPGRIARSGNTSDQSLAEGAIEAGIEYARARLQETSTWKGDLNRVVVNEPTLYIEERDGMVVGLLRPDESVPFSMFRIRFNFYNGSPLVDILDDGLPDPPGDFQFDLDRVSVNNLAGGIRFVPRPDGGSNIVNSLLDGLFQIPPGTVALTVEGFGGNGLGEIGPGKYDPPAGSRHVARKQADVVLGVAYKDGAPDAAMMGGGRIDVTLPGNGDIAVTAKKSTPRARTKGDVVINGGDTPNYVSSGELLYDTMTYSASTVSPGGGATLGDDGGQPFYELEWDDIHQASSDPTEAVHIDGGTYVFDDSGDLHYFDLSWDDYKAFMAALPVGQDPFNHGLNGGVSKQVNANLANVRSDSMPSNTVSLASSKLKFESDVLVTSSTSGVTDFTLVPQRGTENQGGDVSDVVDNTGTKYQQDIELELKPGSSGKTAFTGTGDILIASKINSDKGGSFVTQGDLRIDAGKLDKYGNVGVSFYSQKDVEGSTYDPKNDKYLSAGVDGLFYAWDDFTFRTGDPNTNQADWNKLELTGSIVAYGTDNGPSLEPPGSNAGGVLTVVAREAKFNWDAKKMGDLLDISKFGELTVLERYSYVRH